MSYKEVLKKLTRLKKCPCCGAKAHIEDLTMNKIGKLNRIYGRIICDRNIKGSSARCYIKTVCGEFKNVVRSWNRREK